MCYMKHLIKYKFHLQKELLQFKKPDTTHCLSSFIPITWNEGEKVFEYMITREINAMFVAPIC